MSKLFSEYGSILPAISNSIIVSDAAHGSEMFLHLVEHFHEQEIREPRYSYDAVAEKTPRMACT